MEKKQAAACADLHARLSELSYEMRTPLQTIVGCAALAEQNRADEKTLLHYLTEIRSAADQLSALADQMRDMPL